MSRGKGVVKEEILVKNLNNKNETIVVRNNRTPKESFFLRADINRLAGK